MDNFWFYTNYGVNHVLDVNGYDHVLFLIVLAIPYLFKDWKRVLLLISVFTIGHTLSLLFAAYNVVSIEADLVEFLIPVTIFIVAMYNVFKAGKKERKIAVLFMSTLFFGLIHGLGFAREFTMLIGKAEHKIVPLLEFALGIEIAQVIVVFLVLFIGFLLQTVFRISKRDWIMVISATVVGLVIPMLINSAFLA